jgi:hypothetical protein
MIRFFQNVRKKLAAENRVASYLRYAIGEIVLVVLGILIALYINNMNEQRKTEARIVEILKEVQNDLGKDILKADQTIEYYNQRKSRIKQLLNDELSHEYYKDNPASSKYLIMTANHIKLYDNGYKNLMQNSNNIPDKYRAIINPLYELYVYDKYEIDKYDDRMNEITNQYNEILMKSFDRYYSEFSSMTISDEMINYFSTPEFKNLAFRYALVSWTALSSQLSHFRYSAVDAYLEIAKLIGNEDRVPEYVDHNFIKIDSTILEQYTGIYKLMPADNDNPSTTGSKLRISMKGNHLLVSDASDSSGTGTDIYFRSIDECYDNTRYVYEYHFSGDKDGIISGCVRRIYFTLTAGWPRQYEKIK